MDNMVAKIVEGILVVLAIGIVLFNVALWCYTTTISGYMFTMFVEESTMTRFLGDVNTYILYSSPIVLLAIIASIYLAIKQRSSSNHCLRPHGRLWRLLWTRPLIVNKVVGILNGFDILVILATTFMILWMFLNEYLPQARTLDGQPTSSLSKWKQAGVVLGRVSILPISMLFIPVSRSSPILRMVDIPFEEAMKYHIWLGHLTMTILSGHVGIFIGIFAYKHHMMKLISWNYTGVSILAGLIVFIAGLLMWTTAITYIRRRSFNLFFYVHQLYWIFFAFFAYHVGIKHVGYCMGSIFLYFIDRFFRFQQSRRKMFISSAKILLNDVVELKIPKSSNLKYNATSFLFINIPSISSLEWHPFSVASSPLDEKTDITIYIKPFGITSWTQHLHTLVTRSIKNSKSGCPFATKLSMEGPYGHELNYFLHYSTLLFIAGGIGITPFLAMLSDILHRYELGEKDLPQYVHLIWMVRSYKDLYILHQLSPTSIFPNLLFSNLKLLVDVYVTSGELICCGVEETLSIHVDKLSHNNNYQPYPLVSTSIRDNVWMLSLIISTTIATTIIFGIFHQYVVNTKHFEFGTKIPQWIHVSFFFTSLALGILGVGTLVSACWNKYFDYKEQQVRNNIIIEDPKFQRHVSNPLFESHDSFPNHSFHGCDDLEMGTGTLLHRFYTTKHRGRPNFTTIFDKAKIQFSNKDVGVLVSGPGGLLLDVANQCRNHSSHNYMEAQTFNFHSVSFTL